MDIIHCGTCPRDKEAKVVVTSTRTSGFGAGFSSPRQMYICVRRRFGRYWAFETISKLKAALNLDQLGGF